MRERTNRTVSKTVVSQGTVGSNPHSLRCRDRLPAGAPGPAGAIPDAAAGAHGPVTVLGSTPGTAEHDAHVPDGAPRWSTGSCVTGVRQGTPVQ